MSIAAVQRAARGLLGAGLLVALSSCMAQGVGHGGYVAVPLPLFFLLPNGHVVFPFPEFRSRVIVYPRCAPPVGRYDDHPVAGVPPPPTRVDPDARPTPRLAAVLMPTSDAEMRDVFRRLADKDDETVRRALVEIGRGAAERMRNEWCWGWSRRRLDLPDEFGARVLKLLLPRLPGPSRFDGRTKDEDEGFLFPMLLLVLEEMQYRPALDALMRPGVMLATEGETLDEVWAAFGRAAVAPLVARAREGNLADPTTRARRDLALMALALVRDPDATQDLEALRTDPDPDLRNAAEAALRGMDP